MITEDYVTFEQAEKLKEVGFDSPCYTFYDIIFPKEGKPQFISSPYCNNYNINSEHDAIVSAPSLSLVQKWLREEKNIHICHSFVKKNQAKYGYIVSPWDINVVLPITASDFPNTQQQKVASVYSIIDETDNPFAIMEIQDTNEKALEIAINKVLEFLKSK